MSRPRFLRRVVDILSWPGGRFPEFRRRYHVALTSSDARAIVRGALGTDPMSLPVMEGIAASHRDDVVGRVDDAGRLEVYIGSKYASGLGLVGRISGHDEGSRITARVGWVGLHRWMAPVYTAGLPLLFGFGVYDMAFHEGRPILAAVVMVGVVVARALLVFDTGRKARKWELPTLAAHLDRVLAPHITPPPPRP